MRGKIRSFNFDFHSPPVPPIKGVELIPLDSAYFRLSPSPLVGEGWGEGVYYEEGCHEGVKVVVCMESLGYSATV